MKKIAYLIIAVGLLLATSSSFAHDSKSRRVTSIYLSQKFINEQIHAYMKSKLFKEFHVDLDAKQNQIFVRGVVQVPIEELRAINLDPSLGAFRFQLTVKPETTPEGYLILDFPLNETFFYPETSTDPEKDKVIIPVQMLSIALASARGYFAALSGDFTNFDRRTAKLKALIKALDKSISSEKNPDALDAMKTERESLRLQLAAVPIERKQLQAVSKEVTKLMGYTGEKELNLNDKLAAKKNALIIKIDLQKFTPYLSGVELGGVRIMHDKHDGPKGENYFSIDIDAESAVLSPQVLEAKGPDDTSLPEPPSGIIRINQALFESELIVAAEQKAIGSKLRDLKIDLKEDGIHVSGKYHKWFWNVPFDTTLDIDSTETDKFEVAVREVEIAGIDLEFLTGFVLDAMKTRLNETLKGICTFRYLGELKDHSRALEVTVDPKKLIPALSHLHIVDVHIHDREFLFKVGED